MVKATRNEMLIHLHLEGTQAKIELPEIPDDLRESLTSYAESLELSITHHLRSLDYTPDREASAVDFLLDEGWEILEITDKISDEEIDDVDGIVY